MPKCRVITGVLVFLFYDKWNKMMRAERNKNNLVDTTNKKDKINPLSIEDVRAIKGYKNCSEDQARQIIEQINLLAEILLETAFST